MHITYIHHSCFSVEMEDVIFLFDYYKGTLPTFDPNKHIFVFASHNHHDHFDINIFELANKYPHITYILSNDINLNQHFTNMGNTPMKSGENIHYIGTNVTTAYPVSTISKTSSNNNIDAFTSIQVETLKSTDEGVGFIVSYGGKVIYHAGDLNWWSWPGETEEEYTLMTHNFQKEMDKIKNRHFDIAFVPLDPRQEDRFNWGFDYFMKSTHTKVVFPMHFWMDYSVISKLKAMDIAKDYKEKIIEISRENQEFYL